MYGAERYENDLILSQDSCYNSAEYVAVLIWIMGEKNSPANSPSTYILAKHQKYKIFLNSSENSKNSLSH
jgi:hypothetical protein